MIYTTEKEYEGGEETFKDGLLDIVRSVAILGIVHLLGGSCTVPV